MSEELTGVVVEETVDSGRSAIVSLADALVARGIEDSGKCRWRERDERNIVNPGDLCARDIRDRPQNERDEKCLMHRRVFPIEQVSMKCSVLLHV